MSLVFKIIFVGEAASHYKKVQQAGRTFICFQEVFGVLEKGVFANMRGEDDEIS